jgi:hypothetical protein
VRTVHRARARIITRNDAGVRFDICVYAAPMARAGRNSGGVCHRRIENFFGTRSDILERGRRTLSQCGPVQVEAVRIRNCRNRGCAAELGGHRGASAHQLLSFPFRHVARADHASRAMMLVNQAIAELGDERLAELVSFAPFGPNR